MRRPLVTAIALVLAGNCVAASAPAAGDAPVASSATEVTTQLPRTARPSHYAIEVTPHAEKLAFDGIDAVRPITFAGEIVLRPPADEAQWSALAVALAACVLRPCEVTNPPTGMVLIAEPAVAEVTSTLMLHWPGSMLGAGVAAGMAPLASATLVAPAVAVTLPPQPLTTLGTLATVMPGGRLSVSAAAVAGLLPVLSSVMVSVDAE